MTITNTVAAELRAKIHECGGGEGLPGWCIATGKCSCVLHQRAAEELERLTASRRRNLQATVENAAPQAIAKFWEKVDKSGGPDACWPWRGRCNKDGYGHVFIGGKSDKRAHRVACSLMGKHQPPDTVADHLCRERSCCNPAHIEFIPQGENARRGRIGSSPTCKHGHPMTLENSFPHSQKKGRRTCRLCAHLHYFADKAAKALDLEPRPEWVVHRNRQS
jgi:hypothetical protein